MIKRTCDYSLAAILFSLLLAPVFPVWPLFAQVELSGSLNGLLETDVYDVVGEISVEPHDSLYIQEGAEFVFSGNFTFTVRGYLSATGIPGRLISFHPDDEVNGWGGIDFTPEASDSSLLAYCHISGSLSSAVDFESCGGTVRHCILTDNQSQIRGGGIACREGAAPLIESCTISGNSGNLDGGGIYVYWYSDPVIRDCWIENNATSFGGGIYISMSEPLIERCVIVNNIADHWGGGIYSYSSQPTIRNCSVTGNSAEVDGGGIFCYNFGPDIVNTIIAGNVNAGVFFNSDFTGSLTYSDLHLNDGGDLAGLVPAGLGEITQVNANGDSCDNFYNIFLDPDFQDEAGMDYHLTSGSPCIDAGDPTGPNDPDGTIVDMGAFPFFHLAPSLVFPDSVLDFGEVEVGLTATGSVVIENTAGGAGFIDSLTITSEPAGVITLESPLPLEVAPGTADSLLFLWNPEERVTLTGVLDIYHNDPALDNPVSLGIAGTAVNTAVTVRHEVLPQEIELLQNFPNPFNGATTISYAIPKACHVRLTVFNLTGREIAILTDNEKTAGRHHLLLRADGLSSGLYLYSLQIGDTKKTLKMLLVR